MVVNEINEIKDRVVEKKVEGVAGGAGDFTALTEKLSPVASPSGGDMSFSLIRKKSELAAVAETLAGIQEPLAIDLKTYDKHKPGGSHLEPYDDIRLLSIKAPGLTPWLIDLKEIGYDLGTDLRNILQSREILSHAAKPVADILRAKCGINLNSVWCTQTAQHLLREEKNGSSKIPAWEQHLLLSTPKDPGTHTDKHGAQHRGTYWGGEITEGQYEYAAASVESLHPLKTVLEHALANSPMLHVFHYLNARIPIRSVTSFVQSPFKD